MPNLVLDGTKLTWYHNRVRAWARGERIAPITVDIALTTTCNMACVYCYRFLQHNKGAKITKDHMTAFLDDCKEIGVKGVSLVSDGESSISPAYEHTIVHGRSLGLAMASATNGLLVRGRLLETVLHSLTYLRVNISAGQPKRYREIMGAKEGDFEQVIENIKSAVEIKNKNGLDTTIGMQMVLMPEFEDQIIPLSKLAIELGVDYLVIKHCSDDEFGTLGVDYDKYKNLHGLLLQAEGMSNTRTIIKVKWSKIQDGNIRSYSRCYGPPFLLQLSGTGLIAPCGMLFNERYSEYHMGNITRERFIDVFNSSHYWSVLHRLGSSRFDAQTMCGSLCLQHAVNKYLDQWKKGQRPLTEPVGEPPEHLEFV